METITLKNAYFDLFQKYCSNLGLQYNFWEEIDQAYTHLKRYYHNLYHIEYMLMKVNEVRSEVDDIDSLLFSLYYHDIVYDVVKKDNEKKSAELLLKRLKEIGYPESQCEKCYQQILATKQHQVSEDHDTNILMDADLAILGESWEDYLIYSQNVRREYNVYPDFIYNKGRAKVLESFLERDRIYKTDYFYENYEERARSNMRRELNMILRKH